MLRYFLSAVVFGFIGNASAAEIPPTFEGIKSAIEVYEFENPGQTLTIAKILERLPQSYRSNYNLMYDSGSLQEASFDNPRVIMFGEDAETVIAFNGSPSQATYSSLEMVSVNPLTHQLEFRSIDFPEGDSGMGNVKISPPNPGLCMSCHGPVPHYIWKSYARWPGSYGSIDDVLHLVPGEKEKFLQFRSAAASHPRYKALPIEFPALSDVAPYRPLRPGQDGADRGDYHLALEFRPNFHMSTLFMRRQSRARAEDLMKAPTFNKQKAGLTYYLSNCSRSVDAATVSKVDAFTGVSTAKELLQKYFAVKPSEGWHLEKGPTGLETVTGVAYYFPGSNSFDSGLLGHLWEADLRYDEDLAPYWKPVKLGIGAKASTSLELLVSDKGQRLWERLDEIGPTPSGIGQSNEAIQVFGTGQDLLSGLDMQNMCLLLADKVLRPEAR